MNDIAKNSEEQKTSRIIPLHKKGDKRVILNHRPVANLCSITKVYEKLIYNRLLEETRGLEGMYQHGFRSAHSTTTALLMIQDIIAKHLDGGRKCLIYSVDLLAAFDVFKQEIFLRMYKNKVSHGLARALEDFLTTRKIVCEVKGKCSKALDMPIGCVQGSILGPRLLTLYMGELTQSIGHDNTMGYADDTYIIIEAESTEDIIKEMEPLSTKHVAYLESLGMVVNKAKTEIMIIDKDFVPRDVCFAGTLVRTTPHMKALGLMLSHDFK